MKRELANRDDLVNARRNPTKKMDQRQKGCFLENSPSDQKEHEDQFNCSRMTLKSSYLAAPNEIKKG
jgi:hypothetical protein